ncbi:acyl-CoA dehydrogenase family protein [Halopseudomonas aestusnigri]|uniref:acyl-CoA dehydrogenase family protein n=1 Tax=Halopseudomonas aestusnigri TaxID=857252 RepID=UPI000C8D2902|nr:acyl-CoA dehydrogenase family protein [Halopseudomonas aestusnigri]MAK73944.1 acyl-CoA dehydrogenase [Pseudomonadales bacterium]HBT56670.1 acyl-CoA dehydrogenase [Pseudomonas sp.]MAP75567.1 acyl-CoA dehydrogenase [Pseudomonadales bacterium]MCC4262578.1 acyl-CoA dehydrogenase family protein [Halopseudomonas aestusnigri]UGV31066.1 acyl-CoA dehydrogenase family protein [Halopseudomonas aestusnigri]
MADLDVFRQQTRAWLEENCPQSMRTPQRSDNDACWGGRNFTFASEDQKLWLERMAARGWTAPDWPTEYGGGGLSQQEHKVLREEMARINARPPLSSFGVWMIGPAILKFGSEELKRQHLPPIVRGEIRWCQGYSEPGAGSDLAGLQTRAEDHGDHFIVNGQKIWTSYADKADWMFCLVRTNPDAKKQLGISLVLFDMTTPGVSTRPIKLISGSSPFCETFLDNVRVEKSQVVGEINAGWTIAKYLLTHEREMIGGMGRTAAGQKTLPQIAVDAVGLEDGKLADGMLRGELATWDLDAAAFALTAERVLDEAKAGQGVGAASAMLKYYGTELNKRRQELMVALHGSDGLVWEGEASREGAIARTWLRSKGNSIEGGTTEVQLNVIARNILGLQ